MRIQNKNNVCIKGDNIFCLEKRYYNSDTVAEKLEIISSRELCLSRLKEWCGIDSIWISSKHLNEETHFKVRLFDANQVDSLVIELRNFISQHLSTKSVAKYILPKHIKSNLTPVKVTEKYRRYMQKSCDFGRGASIYRKADVDDILAKKIYTIDEIAEAFNVNRMKAIMLINEYKFDEVTCIVQGRGVKPGAHTKFYSPDKVEKLLEAKKRFFDEYTTIQGFKDYLGVEKVPSHLPPMVEKHEPPSYAIDKKYIQIVYKRSDVKKVCDDYLERKAVSVIKDIQLDDCFDTFKARLKEQMKLKKYKFKESYTKKAWYSYVQDKLARTRVKGAAFNSLINRLVYCTQIISEFIYRNDKEEIYELKSKELELALRSLSYIYYREIYSFLMEISLAMNSIGETPSYKINNIPSADDIYETERDANKDEIYSIEEYSVVFQYCTDIQNRVDEVLNDIEKRNSYKYVSTWLYTILHLNNAWRNGDVKDFPKIDVSDILDENGIDNIHWFKENEVSISIARMVVFRVIQKEFIMSKTQIKGTFFCSDELAPAFATAILLLSLKHRDIISETDNIMIFGTKYNDITPSMIKNFFKSIKLKDFSFKSTKFNKTVMTFIYYIANITGDQKALIYAMKLRAHIEASTTGKYYLKMDINKIEDLSKKLFMRGEFGYIQSLLVKKLNGGKLDFDETTNEIETFNETFGGIVKLNTTIGFMNDLRNKQRIVFEEIDTMTIDQAQRVYIDIFLRHTPSKDSTDMQCLCNKNNCRHTELDCYDCEFHIPTIYMLTDLTKRMLSDIKKCNETNIIPEKFRLALSIEKKKRIIAQANNKFGKDVVYGYMSVSRDEFLDELAKVPFYDERKRLLGKDS